jgi:signal transduction histidine kinase
MKERYVFVYLDCLGALSVCFLLEPDATPDAPRFFIAWMGGAIFLSAFLLVAHLKVLSWLQPILLLLSLGPVFVCLGMDLLPLAAATLPIAAHELRELAVKDPVTDDHHLVTANLLPALVLFLACLVTGADVRDWTLSTLFFCFTIFCLHLLRRREADFRRFLEKSDELRAYREMMQSQRRMTHSIEQTARLVERNRLAARLHDEVGHGISGSILLLEGANAVMDKNPEAARDTLGQVTENLRESVDKIRGMLREERDDAASSNLMGIRNALLKFEGAHPGIRTSLVTSGELTPVSGAVWRCVYENILEALTNMLKHSKANAFSVTVSLTQMLLRVELADNGGPANAAAIDPGIGLQNMEERCAMLYGRCFFRREPDGFHIVMTFPMKERSFS